MPKKPSYAYEPRDLVHPECPNFYMYEIFKSDLAAREEIDNTIGFTTMHHKAAAKLVYHILQPLRNEFGPLFINSWYRSEPLEYILCRKSYENWCRNSGARPSERMWLQYFATKSHPTAEAVDIELPRVLSNRELWLHIQNMGVTYDQVILEYAKEDDPTAGWVHVSRALDPDSNRREAITRPL